MLTRNEYKGVFNDHESGVDFESGLTCYQIRTREILRIIGVVIDHAAFWTLGRFTHDLIIVDLHSHNLQGIELIHERICADHSCSTMVAHFPLNKEPGTHLLRIRRVPTDMALYDHIIRYTCSYFYDWITNCGSGRYVLRIISI